MPFSCLVHLAELGLGVLERGRFALCWRFSDLCCSLQNLLRLCLDLAGLGLWVGCERFVFCCRFGGLRCTLQNVI